MGKKKRKIKSPRFISIEGKREKILYEFLYDLYKPKENNINIQTSKINGGNSDSILEKTIKECNNKDYCFAWFDEDISLTKKLREILENKWCCKIEKEVKDTDLQKVYNNKLKNPILIVSNPCSIEGLLLKIFEKNISEKPTTKNLKMAIDGLFGTLKDEEYYKKHLTKELLEEKRKSIYELNLLLKIFEN